MSAPTILIMAGGTGGHVFPGLAVADYLRQAGWRVVWLGTEAGMELKLVPQHGYTTEVIRFSGLRGKGLLRALLLPFNLLIACVQSACAILVHRPDVVLIDHTSEGFGATNSQSGIRGCSMTSAR